MKKNCNLTNNSKFRYIRKELNELYGKDTTSTIVQLANQHYEKNKL